MPEESGHIQPSRLERISVYNAPQDERIQKEEQLICSRAEQRLEHQACMLAQMAIKQVHSLIRQKETVTLSGASRWAQNLRSACGEQLRLASNSLV